MSALAVWLFVLSATPACDAKAEHAARWSELAKGAPNELSAHISSMEKEVGPVLRTKGDDELSSTQLAERAGRRLKQVCAFLAQKPAPAIEPARQRLAEIFDRPEFAHARKRNTNLLERVLLWLQSWLSQLFRTSGAETFSNVARAAVLGGAFAAVGVAGVQWARWKRRRRTSCPTPAADERRALADPATHLESARQMLEPDPREAIRQALFALLSSLEQRRLARPDRVKTNRELAAELPKRGAPPELTEAVSALVQWYDCTFYSLSPVLAEEARRFVDRVHQLIGAAA